jgi:hypothetical protein
MKKIVGIAALLAVMTVSASAFADGEAASTVIPAHYTGSSSDSVDVDADGYSTVLITKDANDSIVYIDQASSAFSGSMNFLLKSINPSTDAGRYTVLLGSGSGDPKETYFYVGVDSNGATDVYMDRLQNERTEDEGLTYDIGYFADVAIADVSSFSSLKVGYRNSGSTVYAGLPFNQGSYTEISGEGNVHLYFQLNDVPADKKDDIAVYLSTATLPSSQ